VSELHDEGATGAEFFSPFGLPPVVMAPVSGAEYLDMLRRRFCPAYMPSQSHNVRESERPTLNSKPYYKTAQSIESLNCGSGTYMYDRSFYAPIPSDSFIEKDKLYFGADLGDLQLLTCLNDDKCYARARPNRETEWSEWIIWNPKNSIAIDRFFLAEVLDIYA